MAYNNKSYQPAHSISVKAVEDIPGFRFVSHLGTLCAENQKSIGVTEIDWNEDDVASVITLGTIPVETATTINIGDDVTSAADGKAQPAGAEAKINGRALDNAETGEFVKLNLVP